MIRKNAYKRSHNALNAAKCISVKKVQLFWLVLAELFSIVAWYDKNFKKFKTTWQNRTKITTPIETGAEIK